MARSTSSSANVVGSPAANLPRVTSTRLSTDIGTVTREVMREGGAVITRHDAPLMVLLSIDRYAELERASTPDLDALSGRFDALYARMQAPGVAERTLAGLDLGASTRVGSTAQRATKKVRRHK